MHNCAAKCHGLNIGAHRTPLRAGLLPPDRRFDRVPQIARGNLAPDRHASTTGSRMHQASSDNTVMPASAS